MKLVALTEGPQHVCHRYRIAPFVPALAARGWQVETLPLARDTFPRQRQLRQLGRADVVWLQRKLLPWWQLQSLRRRVAGLIYDVDDAVFYRDSFATKGHASLARLAAFWATVHAADLVLAGNQFLAEQVEMLVGREKIQRLPTCVAPEQYSVARHARRDDAVRLAWIGQKSTLPSLRLAEPLLARAAAVTPHLRLRVICDRPPEIAALPVELCAWSAATEAEHLAECDIGLSYLPDDPWSQGKCGLKVLQYMAAGLPVVANPVAMNRQLVIDGQTGFLAESADDWSAAVARLARDPELRQQMGRAGRALVEREYSVSQWSPRMVRWFDALADPAARFSRLAHDASLRAA